MPGTLHPPSPEALARVRPFFNGTFPVPVRLWAMLDGIVTARLYVDDVETPTWALLQELAALQGTIGFCVLHEGEVVAEAVAGPFACGIADFGVGTKPEYRGPRPSAALHSTCAGCFHNLLSTLSNPPVASSPTTSISLRCSPGSIAIRARHLERIK